MAPAPATFWIPLESETGRKPGSVKLTAAPSGLMVPFALPTFVPAATVTLVPSGRVMGVPAESAMAGPELGRVAVTFARSVARVLPGTTVNGCKG